MKRYWIVGLVTLVVALACANGVPIPDPSPYPQLRLLVDNQSWDRVELYVVTTPTSGHVVGECAAVRKCILDLPPAMVGFVYSVGWLRMAYRPKGGAPRTLYYIGEIQMPAEHVVAVVRNSPGQGYLSQGTQ